MFKKPFTSSPSSKNFTLSRLKLENVVNPPSIPTTRNTLTLWLKFRQNKTPITKLPSTFTPSVVRGKWLNFSSSPAKNLHPAPIKPPSPAKSKFASISDRY